jgi:hypothetical protein
MTLAEQNWHNLFDTYTCESKAWHGIWTSYSPEKEIIKSYLGIREFRSNRDRTKIDQTNTYTYDDGSTDSKQWQLNKENCSLLDGVFHPAVSSMRALSFGDGKTAWIAKKLEENKSFAVELFFRDREWRTSVIPIYGSNGNLERITQIYERLNSYPQPAVEEEIGNFSGKWKVTRESMTPDLNITSEVTVEDFLLNRTEGENKNILLPDRFVANIPTKLLVGQEFIITVTKLVRENLYKRLVVKYDRLGQFALFISETGDRMEASSF